MTDNGTVNKASMAPGRVVAIAWVMLAALLIVFAADVHKWAQAAEDGSAANGLEPVTAALKEASDSTGVSTVRDTVEESVNGLYESTPMLASRVKPMPIATVANEAAPVEFAVSETATVAAADETDKPYQPKRILIIGDSAIEGSLGREIEERLELFDGLEVKRFGLHSTGLARPDYFNWMDKLTELKEEFKPDLVISYLGDNDCQGLSNLEGEPVGKFGSEEWVEIYGQRNHDFVALMCENGGHGVIVGMPIMRSKKLSNQMETLNTVLAESTEKAGGIFLSTWEMTADEEGKYMSKVVFEGQERLIRAGDGIHLSSHGAGYVAQGLIDLLREHFTLTGGPEAGTE